MTLYDWPRAAAFGRVIPKTKIYEHAGANTALKDLFVREVDQIVWSHKLAPETVNLAATKQVAEIQVFRITARTATLDREVLRAIDKAIPFPLIFEVAHGGRVRLAAAYKRPSEADSARWVVGDYFQGDWLPEDAARTPLPVALNMGALYERLLEPLVAGQTARLVPGMGEAPQTPFAPAEADRPVSLEERIAQAEAIKAQAREVERIKARLGREKQFNKRVAINAELRAAKQELERLTAGNRSAAMTNEYEDEHGQAEDAQPRPEPGQHREDPRVVPRLRDRGAGRGNGGRAPGGGLRSAASGAERPYRGRAAGAVSAGLAREAGGFGAGERANRKDIAPLPRGKRGIRYHAKPVHRRR